MQTFADLSLSRRLEIAEAKAGAAFVEARAKCFPAVRPEWTVIAGCHAMFDGPVSPVTQTFGLGLHEPISPAALDRIEGFFTSRGAPAIHEISPMADREIWPLLAARGYIPVEFTSVMFLDLPAAQRSNQELSVRVASAAEHDLWAETAGIGWSGSPQIEGDLHDLMRVISAADGIVPFLVTHDDRAIATGALNIHGGVALFAGASTIPDARKRGAQRALLEARLRYATEAGCDIAMMCAEPGSSSQRNAEREGFRIAYTRTKWKR